MSARSPLAANCALAVSTRPSHLYAGVFVPHPIKERNVRRLALAAPLIGMLAATGAFAADPPAADPALAQFRQAYTTGTGLSYVVIKDDKNYAPPYNMTPVVRKEVADKNPKLVEALNAVSAKLNNETMAKLNATVDVDKKTPEEVAETFLKQNGLI